MGDVMLGRLVNDFLKIHPSEYPWGNILPILEKADLRLCNLECVLSDKGLPVMHPPKMFHFRSDEKNVETVLKGHIDIVSLANNHVLDYGKASCREMMQLLDRKGIRHAGAGVNRSFACTPAFFTHKTNRVAFLACTDNEPHWAATDSEVGVYYVPIDVKDERAKSLFMQVHALHETGALVIVSLHWGPNWGYLPPLEHPPFAHALIDAGADIVFGHSGHVFRGIEIYKHRPILYCAGDFIDDYAIDEVERNDESFLFIVETRKEKIERILLYPTLIQQFQAVHAFTERREAILSQMKLLSLAFGTKMTIQDGVGMIEVAL